MRTSFITIEREYGSGGTKIARLLAGRTLSLIHIFLMAKSNSSSRAMSVFSRTQGRSGRTMRVISPGCMARY